MKLLLKKILRCFLLLLFLGYYGSITLFTHSHIVNEVVIVHSHPYNPFSKDKPSSHQHSTNEFVLISLLSHFLTTVVFTTFSIGVLKVVFKKYILSKNENNYFSRIYVCFNGLRAPPLNIHN
ncbi:MAG: hypothetical protein BWX63_02002 [Bacteroidetes bacterium ADurb.Bin041]|nr:MAG: hypothetical protein BWX63_02002 [Bacteroidetes bacterium ADurb.Bin041]